MTMRLAPMILVSLALAGCPKSGDTGPGSGSGPVTTPPPVTIADAAPPPAPPDAAAATPDAAPTVTAALQHEACSDTIACAADLTCVTYRAVTGKELSSCEIQCTKKTKCPTGQKCMTVRDGPRNVCWEDGGGGGGGGGGGSGGTSSLPKQTEACPAGSCATGLTCVEYYGIAGPRGPKFTSCEIPCKGGAACPNGQTCRTIADGPGQVCRP